MPNYPVSLKIHEMQADGRVPRAVSNGKIIEEGKSTIGQNDCLNDISKAWNIVPDTIKLCNSLYSVKKQTKMFVHTLTV